MSLVDRLAHQLAGGPAEPIVAPWPVTDADLEELGKGHAGTYFRIGRRRGWEYILPAFPVVLSEHDDLPAAAILERQAPDGSRAYVALREVPAGSLPPPSCRSAPRHRLRLAWWMPWRKPQCSIPPPAPSAEPVPS